MSLKQVSSTCHVSLLAALDTDYKHKFSFTSPHPHKRVISTHIYPAMVHRRVADQHKSHLLQVMSPSRLSSKTSTPKRPSLKTSSPEELSLTGILGQIRIKYWKEFWEMTIKIVSPKVRMKLLTNSQSKIERTSSNHCGRLSYVPSQPAMIPCSRSMLSRAKRPAS